MQKILILGKNGMLGQEMLLAFRKKDPQGSSFDITAWGRNELDITNKKSVHEKIKELQPGVVINATGYTNVDGAETERETAFAVNAEAVGNLAQVCARIGATLIHFSTDYVFDGKEPQGYRENDTEHIVPVNVYGESKRAGELRITPPYGWSPEGGNYELRIKNKEWKYFIIRTSWLYGAYGKNFVDAMLARAKEGQTEFKVVNDQFGKPTYTEDLAKRVMWIIEQRDKLASGIYHCANEDMGIAFQKVASDSKKLVQVSNLNQQFEQFGSNVKYQISNAAGISWYMFAKEIFEQAHSLGIIKEMPRLTPCNTTEFPRPATRPRYSALINTKLPPMRDLKEALGEYMGKIIASG